MSTHVEPIVTVADLDLLLFKTAPDVVALRPMAYKPTPIETASISLPGELSALTERLAENAHDLWAEQRLAQGWSYGPQRDDEQKQHPCLVAYDQLPESEKEYDRLAALGTLKAILHLGYRIVPPQP